MTTLIIDRKLNVVYATITTKQELKGFNLNSESPYRDIFSVKVSTDEPITFSEKPMAVNYIKDMAALDNINISFQEIN